MNNITVLFCDENSNYKKLGCNVYDQYRNALNFKDKTPCIYHPPCRTWSRLRGLAKVHPGEHLLAVWSIFRIWRYGGVLEHPAHSSLWKLLKLPLPGTGYDIHDGFSISVNQHWFGHKCEKNTWLYIKGCNIKNLPQLSLNFDAIEYTISTSKKINYKKEISKKRRSETPIQFALFLIDILNSIKNTQKIKN
jgi:hypothetical protein